MALHAVVLAGGVGALGYVSLGPRYAALGVGPLLLALVDLIRGLRPRTRDQALRFGGVTLAWVLGAIAQLAIGPVTFALHETLPRAEADYLVVELLALALTLGLAGSSLVIARASDVAHGTPGRVRLAIGAIATCALAYAQLAFSFIVWLATHNRVSFELDMLLGDTGSSAIGSYLETVEAVAIAEGVLPLLYGAYAVAGAAALAMVGGLVSSWFLVPVRVRAVFFYVIAGFADTPLLASKRVRLAGKVPMYILGVFAACGLAFARRQANAKQQAEKN